MAHPRLLPGLIGKEQEFHEAWPQVQFKAFDACELAFAHSALTANLLQLASRQSLQFRPAIAVASEENSRQTRTGICAANGGIARACDGKLFNLMPGIA